MNGHPHWALHQYRGTVQASRIAGVCNLLCPAAGIESVSIQSHPIPAARFLAPSLPTNTADSSALPEAFARGGDLAAIYAAADEFPFRSQAYWRLTSHPTETAGQAALASCELVAATQTDLLDSRPEITVSSTMSVKSTFRLIQASDASFAELDPTVAHHLTPADGTGCLLYRLETTPFSYAEMVFPLDFETTRLDIRTTGNQHVATAVHQLFSHRLEKGVVLRSRILGLWMLSESDLRTTAAHYQLFAKSDPPLTA